MGRSAMQSLSSVWKSKYISTTTKVRLLKALVWSIAIYGSESWTLRSKEEKYIEAFEMWCYRRLLRIPWTQHKKNEWILCELKVKRELLGRVKSLKLGFYGHITRKYKSVEKQMLRGGVPGYRNRGRQRRRWTEWHHGMDWDEDWWSCCSSGRSWSLERDTTRRQPFLWKKALNDDDDEKVQW